MALTPDIRYYASLTSTMDEARSLAEAGAPQFTVVQAGEQTAGRGRFGNTWSAPAGNLYITVILRPDVPLRRCAQFSFGIALALSDIIPAPSKLKWPNDVLVDGKKIAGILLEMEAGKNDVPDFLLAGIGLNIACGPEGSARMSDYTTDNAAHIRDELLQKIAHWYERWQKNQFDDIRSAWLSRAKGLGEPVVVRMAERRLEGVFEGLDADGNLILREASGAKRTISSGDVHFGP